MVASSDSAESLIEERVAQLEAISQRRNELLGQMYKMIQRKRDYGTSLLELNDEEEEDEDEENASPSPEMKGFLDTYDLNKNSLIGSFVDFSVDDLFASEEEEAADVDILDSEPVPVLRDATPAAALTLPGPTNDQKQEDDEPSTMDIDEPPKPVVLVEGLESDDILVTAPAEGQPSESRRSTSARAMQEDEDDDRDELDIIGSLSPSHSRSETSLEPQTRTTTATTTTTQEASRADSEIVEAGEEEEEGLSDVEMNVSEPPPQPQPPLPPQDAGNSPTLIHHPPSILEPLPQTISPAQLLVRSPAVEVPHPNPNRQTPLFIPAPTSPFPGIPSFKFQEEGDSEAKHDTSVTAQMDKKYPQTNPSPAYTLPALKSLPAEFHRKKTTKAQRKKEREREREKEKEKVGGGGGGVREDWAPMGLNKWGASIRANPVYKKVGRATKCVTTKEWNVSWTEIRLIRTIERVEQMKDTGRWSFRQPKKQRGVGGLTKTHWDYLLDEMKWMRTDFREERKWKTAVAFHLGTAVLEWHAAGTLADRVRRKIVVLWKPPRKENDEEVDEQMDVDDTSLQTPMVDYNSSDNDNDNDEDEPDPDPEPLEANDVTDALDASTAIQDALDIAEATASVSGTADQPQSDNQGRQVEPKIEESEDTSALHKNGAAEESMSMDVDNSTQQDSQQGGNGVETASKMEEDSKPSGLKASSANPLLLSSSQPQPEASSSSNSKHASKPNAYAPMRERIAKSDDSKLFLDLDDYDDLVKDLAALSTEENILEIPPPPHDLSAIFPDLQPLGLLNVPTTGVTEVKKKSDRKSDKDDPNKRAEDTTYTKLVPLGEFMHCKPTLLGPLNPAKRWKQGKWVNQEDSASNSENDSSLTVESLCDLFGIKPATFEKTQPPREPKDARKRVGDQQWTQNDDLLLKTLVERYPNNWPLIADAFNSSRVTISIDRRIPWDCFERWSVRWGPGSSLVREGSEMVSPIIPDGMSTPAPAARDQMTTRGVKRLASVSVGGIASPGGSAHEPKKRRRHNLMFDAIRKAAKKREQNQKATAAQKKPSVVHDTHGQYSKMPRYTPQELSRIKAERDMKDQEAIAMSRRQQQEQYQRQQLLQQASRMPGGPAAQQAQQMLQQQQQQQQQQANGVGRPPGAAMPSQAVPQIRNQVNISQQQRLPTNMTAGGARLSPQQMLAAQQQARMMQQAAAQAQAQAQAANNMNGIPSNMGNTHLSPPHNNRAHTSSPAPHGSPPHASATPVNTGGTPRPPSTQPHMGQSPQVPANALPRQPGNMGHYFQVASNMQPNAQTMQNMQNMQTLQQNMQNVSGSNFTPEQMGQAYRLRELMQRQQQAGMPQGQNGTYPSQP